LFCSTVFFLGLFIKYSVKIIYIFGINFFPSVIYFFPSIRKNHFFSNRYLFFSIR
jgi:hypothetical protein